MSVLLWSLTSLMCFVFYHFPVGEDAARCAMSSFNLCPSSVFRRRLLPADEWEEAHVDLPCLWQACSLWAAHYWWVRRQKHVLTCLSPAAPHSSLENLHFNNLYVKARMGKIIKATKILGHFQDSWYKSNHGPACCVLLICTLAPRLCF